MPPEFKERGDRARVDIRCTEAVLCQHNLRDLSQCFVFLEVQPLYLRPILCPLRCSGPRHMRGVYLPDIGMCFDTMRLLVGIRIRRNICVSGHHANDVFAVVLLE